MKTEITAEVVLVRDMALDAIQLTPDALQAKEQALEASALIGRVTNDNEELQAHEAQRSLDSLARYCEKSRKMVKEPVLELGRKIDKAAKDFATELEEEAKRISALVGGYAALKEAKRMAAEAAARLEQERIQRERFAEEQRLAREAAEAQRKLDDEAAALAKKARESMDAAEVAKLEQERIELEKVKAQAQADTLQKFDDLAEKASRDVAAVVVAPVAKLEGQVIRTDWEITVTDVWALSRAHPGCVKIEPRLTEIKSILNAGGTVVGVTAKKVTNASTRGNK